MLLSRPRKTGPMSASTIHMARLARARRASARVITLATTSAAIVSNESHTSWLGGAEYATALSVLKSQSQGPPRNPGSRVSLTRLAANDKALPTELGVGLVVE